MLQGFKKRNTWDLIWELFRTDFKLKYNDSVLGFIWVLIKPFSLFLIMYLVISNVFKVGGTVKNFPLYMLLGNMIISFWNEGTAYGMDSILGKAGMIAKVNFPRYIVLLSTSMLASVNFLINLLVFIVIASTRHIGFNIFHAIWFLFCMLGLYLLIVVTSMFLSVTYVKFRDLKQIWDLFNQLIFWATPIVYPASVLISKSKLFDIILTKINPISVFLMSARDAILYNDITYQVNVFIWFGIVIIIGFFGYIHYKKSIKRIAEFF